jgi:two-component system, OmpR family, response regulator
MTTILVVNDDVALVKLYRVILEQQGYDVIGVCTSYEAFDILTSVKPDLIITNIARYPMDGWEFTQQIKGNPKTKNIPIVITSAREYTHRDLQQYGNLIEEYVLLPAGKERLIEVIERVMQNVDAKTG